MPSAEFAAKQIIAHYKKQGYSVSKACRDAVVGLKFVCNPKTLYHISRGQKASSRVEFALHELHKTIPPVYTDTRHRLSTQYETFEDKELVKNTLTNEQRAQAQLDAAKRISTS